jgi:hypothetical protein
MTRKNFIANVSSSEEMLPVKTNATKHLTSKRNKFVARTIQVNSENHSIQNLDELGVHGFVSYISEYHKRDIDVGVIRSWFRRKRLEAQGKHLDEIYNLVRKAREHTSNIVEFKAQLMTQQTRIDNLIIALEEESEMMVERQREEYETFLAGQENQRETYKLELDRLKYENERLKYEAEELKGRAEQEKQKARLIQLRGDLIEKITKDLDFSDINMKQVFVIIEMVKDSTSEADIITAEARWEQMKAEAKISEAEAQSKGYEAEQKGYKTKKMKTELEKIGIKIDE